MKPSAWVSFHGVIEQNQPDPLTYQKAIGWTLQFIQEILKLGPSQHFDGGSFNSYSIVLYRIREAKRWNNCKFHGVQITNWGCKETPVRNCTVFMKAIFEIFTECRCQTQIHLDSCCWVKFGGNFIQMLEIRIVFLNFCPTLKMSMCLLCPVKIKDSH